MKAILVIVAVTATSNAALMQFVLREGCSDSWLPLIERLHATQNSEQGISKTLEAIYIPNGCPNGCAPSMKGTSTVTMITVL